MLFFWAYPGIVVVGRLDQWWFSPPGLTFGEKAVLMSDFISVRLGFWALLGWHSVIAYCMYALIARLKPAVKLHRMLKTAWICIMVAVVVKTSIDVIARFYQALVMPQLIFTFLVVLAVFMGVIYLYGATFYSLCTNRTSSPTVRSLRVRLLLLCSYMLVFLIIASSRGYTWPQPLKQLGGCFLLLQGFFDSIVLGHLCDSWSRCCQRSSRNVRRQTTDNRVRFGSSDSSISIMKSSCRPSKTESLEMGTVEFMQEPTFLFTIDENGCSEECKHGNSSHEVLLPYMLN